MALSETNKRFNFIFYMYDKMTLILTIVLQRKCKYQQSFLSRTAHIYFTYILEDFSNDVY